MVNDSTGGGFFRHLFTGKTSLIVLAIVVLLLSGCARQGAEPEEPVLPLQEAPGFSHDGEAAQPELWWTVFDDPVLNSRIDRALNENFSLSSAWQRLRAAKAVLRSVSADFQPNLDATADARTTSNDSPDSLLLGLEAGYEVDLWGRIDSRAAAEAMRVQASAADYRSAAISLSAEVTSAWFRLIETWQQRKLLLSQIETNQQVLDLLKARLGIGLVSSADVLRQQQLIESTRAELITVETELQTIRHQLAVLEGRPPQSKSDLEFDRLSLPELLPTPRTGLPAELVNRRPDVQSAFFRLRAADADLAAAVSNQYPRLTLSASLETAAEDASTLFVDWISSLAGRLLSPLIDGGRREAEVERALAIRQQRLDEYGQAVLIAFKEVEDALIRESKQYQRIENLKQRLELAKQTRQQLQLEYFNGVSAYISVLTALTDEQRLQRDILAAELQLLEFRIALYRALAGGFETPRELFEATEESVEMVVQDE
jgi:multidrug efflux system outer membrane protein